MYGVTCRVCFKNTKSINGASTMQFSSPFTPSLSQAIKYLQGILYIQLILRIHLTNSIQSQPLCVLKIWPHFIVVLCTDKCFVAYVLLLFLFFNHNLCQVHCLYCCWTFVSTPLQMFVAFCFFFLNISINLYFML